MISQKNVQLLLYLCDCAQEDRPASIVDLAARFHISTRMVRYNLDQISYYLASNGFKKIRRPKGAGVQLDADRETIAQIRERLNGMQNSAYILSRQERELFILIQLFDCDKPVRYEELADALSVSRKTVISDMRHIRENEAESDLEIEPTKRGIWYSGSEFHIRRAVVDRLCELFAVSEIWRAVAGEAVNRSIPVEKRWAEAMHGVPAELFERELRAVEEREDYPCTDDMFYLLMILSAISIVRAGAGHVIERREPVWNGEFRIHEVFLRRVCERMNVELPESEYQYVGNELGRMLNFSRYEQAERVAQLVSMDLLTEASKRMGRNYYLDEKLRMDLYKHLFRLIKNNMSGQGAMDGPTVDAILKSGEGLRDCVRGSLMRLNGADDSLWSDTECALIMMHFFAADERRNAKAAGPYKALVICTNGVGSARLVSAKVEKCFPQIQVTDVTSIHNMNAIIERSAPDFILTTIPLNVENIPVIRVSALLSEEDLANIREFMSQHPRQSGTEKERLYWEIRELIDHTCQVLDAEGLEKNLRRILNLTPPEDQSAAMLAELIRWDGIQLGVEATDWEEAVRESARPLVRMGQIEQRYVDAMLKNIRENGPYIVITPGIAMPHSLPQDGVNESCIGLTILKEPVSFGNPVNDPVRIVICLGTLDGAEHMASISQLINILGDPAALECVLRAQSREEILMLITRYGGRER